MLLEKKLLYETLSELSIFWVIQPTDIYITQPIFFKGILLL